MNKRLVWIGAATAAVLVVLASGAFAASKYLITSTHQIAPTVLKQLQTSGLNAKDVSMVTSSPQTLCVTAGSASTICTETIAVANCPAGTKALSGGWSISALPEQTIADNHPTAGDNGWEVGLYNDGTTGSFTAYALCAKGS